VHLWRPGNEKPPFRVGWASVGLSCSPERSDRGFTMGDERRTWMSLLDLRVRVLNRSSAHSGVGRDAGVVVPHHGSPSSVH